VQLKACTSGTLAKAPRPSAFALGELNAETALKLQQFRQPRSPRANGNLDFRWAEGRFDQLPGLASDLVNREVSVIFQFGRTSMRRPRAPHLLHTTLPDFSRFRRRNRPRFEFGSIEGPSPRVAASTRGVASVT
jgi:hypothetical protein